MEIVKVLNKKGGLFFYLAEGISRFQILPLLQVLGIHVDRFQKMGITDHEKDQVVLADIGDALVCVGGDAYDVAGVDFGRCIVADFDEAGSREHDVAFKGAFEAMEAGFFAGFHAGAGERNFRVHIGARHFEYVATFFKEVFACFVRAGDVIHAAGSSHEDCDLIDPEFRFVMKNDYDRVVRERQIHCSATVIKKLRVLFRESVHAVC